MGGESIIQAANKSDQAFREVVCLTGLRGRGQRNAVHQGMLQENADHFDPLVTTSAAQQWHSSATQL
jgi:hypothetical protein